jgi:hypothetical protein
LAALATTAEARTAGMDSEEEEEERELAELKGQLRQLLRSRRLGKPPQRARHRPLHAPANARSVLKL